MNSALPTIGLQLQLAMRRLGLANCLAGALLLLACGGFFGMLPQLRAHDAQRKVALQYARTSLAQSQVVTVPAPSQAERNLRGFRDLLGESRFAEQQVKTLFSLAAKNGLILSQGEYKLLYEKNGEFNAYSILLPVHGQYGAIRTFCRQVLLAIPFASLDQVDFKREAVGNTNLEAKLRFTLYLDRSTGGSPEREGMRE